MSQSFEPRAHCPPKPPSPNFQNNPYDESQLQVIQLWDLLFDTQVKLCGENLQRHKCHNVCHKYGHNSECRFRFPHKIINTSYFDESSNLIYLMCCDKIINFYNPHILVYCWHNHDIQSILSGHAAKAAMFYISDYTTKMDQKTYQILTLLSKAVLNASNVPAESPVEKTHILLHKCLTQFSREQQIHAQQAIQYIHQIPDGLHHNANMATSTCKQKHWILAQDLPLWLTRPSTSSSGNNLFNMAMRVHVMMWVCKGLRDSNPCPAGVQGQQPCSAWLVINSLVL